MKTDFLFEVLSAKGIFVKQKYLMKSKCNGSNITRLIGHYGNEVDPPGAGPIEELKQRENLSD